jgi:hypothetical protein
MRFQGENTVDQQHPSHHVEREMKAALPTTTPSTTTVPALSSNGVLLNATQMDLESKYFIYHTTYSNLSKHDKFRTYALQVIKDKFRLQHRNIGDYCTPPEHLALLLKAFGTLLFTILHNFMW